MSRNNSRSTPEKLFFPVENVKFADLYDWSNPKEKCRTHTASVPQRLTRQDSHTGSLVKLNETQVALFRIGDQVYAINEKCPHAGGPLHLGDIEVLPDRSLCVKCPWHSWKIGLDTGQVRIPNGRDRSTPVYEVLVKDDGAIWIGFNEFSPKYFSPDAIDL